MAIRSSLWPSLVVAIAAMLPVACSSSPTDTESTTAGTTSTDSSTGGGQQGTGGTTSTGTGTGIGEQSVGMMLNVSIVEMMGQQIGLAVGAFYPETFIAPFDPTKGEAGLLPDTCRTPQSAAAECQTDADCPKKGQVCKLEKDSSGQPTPGTGSCENPTGSPIDIGPMSMSGFLDGSKVLKSNPSQSGAYTVDGAGDGTVSPGSIAGDADYAFSGDGDPAKGLGAFEGTLHVPPAINLLAPVPTPSQFGKEITIDTTADLALEWEGSSNGFVKITIQGDNSGVECLAKDDGSFTIPASAMANLKLASFSFFNIVLLERTTYGTASGTGLVNPQISSKMTIMVNAAAPAAQP